MPSHDVTHVLKELHRGNAGAEERLFALVYGELRRMAAGRIAHEGASVGASPTDLAHEAYGRLAGEEFENRRHLFFAYARTMRQILIESARKRRAAKRGGELQRTEFPSDLADTPVRQDLDALEVSDLLDSLKQALPRASTVVELRFFGGLCDADIADILDIDARTVRRDWVEAKEWMRGHLTGKSV